MIYHDLPWFSMIYHDLPWFAMIHHDLPRLTNQKWWFSIAFLKCRCVRPDHFVWTVHGTKSRTRGLGHWRAWSRDISPFFNRTRSTRWSSGLNLVRNMYEKWYNHGSVSVKFKWKWGYFWGITVPLGKEYQEQTWWHGLFDICSTLPKMIPIHHMICWCFRRAETINQPTTNRYKSGVSHVHTRNCIHYIYIYLHIHIISPCLSLKKPLRPVFARKFWSRRCGSWSLWIMPGKKVILYRYLNVNKCT